LEKKRGKISHGINPEPIEDFEWQSG